MATSKGKIVDSNVEYLDQLFAQKFQVDFYQREYVWQRKQIEDLVMDLSTEFLKNWDKSDSLEKVEGYDPYYMGEVVLSLKESQPADIIDGQQRITSLNLLLIYLIRNFGNLSGFPSKPKTLVFSDHYGTEKFNLDIPERYACMKALLNTGEYTVQDNDGESVKNLVARYSDIGDCWNPDINEENAVAFTYWVMSKIAFSKVWTNSDEFAYVIFETMNDRGLSLTQIEMLRSYLLANIDEKDRDAAKEKFDQVIHRLNSINLTSKSKLEFEFFKLYFRGHYAEDLSQSPNSESDFIRIGKEFHRWVRDNSAKLGLDQSADFVAFIDRIDYFSRVYVRIYNLIRARDTSDFLYLIVNSDYGFTLQPALLLASIRYGDDKETIDAKINLVSKYLTKVLSWRVWNHWMISQSSLEAPIYDLCKSARELSFDDLSSLLCSDPIDLPTLNNAPTLNQQNKNRLRVLLALITAIVGRESREPDYLLGNSDIEVEHIWSDHYERHASEFENEIEFNNARNNIGDLLLLPKSFNASYGDDDYSVKVKQYFSQNILAQSLNEQKYKNAPGFLKFITDSNLPFVPYEAFTRKAITERAELYKQILLWNWDEQL